MYAFFAFLSNDKWKKQVPRRPFFRTIDCVPRAPFFRAKNCGERVAHLSLPSCNAVRKNGDGRGPG